MTGGAAAGNGDYVLISSATEATAAVTQLSDETARLAGDLGG